SWKVSLFFFFSSPRYTDFQLVNGSSRCEGRVEIQVSGVWGTLCDSHWDLSDANVLCRHLNCGLAMKPPEEVYFGEGSVQILADTFYCSGTESHLWDCPVTVLGASSCSRRKVASVICSENGQLRLVNGGRDPCSGRVEIYYNDTWGTICDDSWDMSDAHVVCRQLGCGVALKVMDSSHFGKGSGSIWLDELSCFGNESYLGECPSLHWGQHDCSHKEDAGVICSESLDLRLVSDDYDCAGWLEVFHNGTWGSVCSNLMDINTVSVICRHLSCGNKGYLDLHSNHRNLKDSDCPTSRQCTGISALLFLYLGLSEGRCFQAESVTRDAASFPDKDKLQLRGGETPCSGRVEIWHDGSWGTVCDDSWDLAEANVVCQQLGCGSALASLEGAELVQCRGKETSLWDCPAEPWGQNDCKHDEDAGVVCSADLELRLLVGGDGPCSGRVEVNSGGEWATVCNWKFTHSTANVICAELGCGVAVSVLNGTHFGRGNGQIWAKEFQCKEDESHLQFCPTVPIPQGVCSHNMDVGVICSRKIQKMLVNGSSRCEGRVEIQVSGVWGTLCDSHWDLSDANVLCRHLNCGLAMKPPEEVYFGEGSVQILADTFYCSGTESHLWDCPVTVLGASSCSRRKVASVICSGYDVLFAGNQIQVSPFNDSQSDQAKVPVLFSENGQLRLVNGGRDPCSGRVEIYYNDTWGTICDDSWDMSDAHVVCRQLGCGVALKVMDSSHFGKGSGSIWLDELSCFGNESYLGECPSLHWGQHDCSHKEDAGVICSESLDLRLVSDDYDCAGWLEVFHNGTWGSVCSNLMDINTVSVICRHLSCGNKGYLDFHSNHRNLPIKWVDKINCQGQEPSLWHCPSQPWNQASCFEDQEAYITCEDKLQLRGGETPCSGRVEIWHDGSWGTVCDDSWDLAEANVVCQQLGCGSALASLEGAAFGSGNGTIWLDEVQCRGKETSLWDCPAEPWGQNDCKHDEDAGVVCSGECENHNGLRTLKRDLRTSISDLCPFISAVSGYGESLYESMYEEINYDLTENEEDLLSNPGKCILCSPSLALPAYEH
uniref:SRCR domain-containing protein n=1 Tax=Monodelphis domestica TaxID=13616 RepID=A0A5F8H8H3_MONDO